MLFDRGKIRVDLYINYGNDEIKHHEVRVCPGTSVLEALKEAADIEFTPDDSATGHQGSMVTAINDIRSDAKHCWIYYVFERGAPGWSLPKEMPDRLKVSEGMRIGWRYYDMAMGEEIKDGPLWTSRCVSKTRTCARQF
jgi:hypothetical protein